MIKKTAVSRKKDCFQLMKTKSEFKQKTLTKQDPIKEFGYTHNFKWKNAIKWLYDETIFFFSILNIYSNVVLCLNYANLFSKSMYFLFFILYKYLHFNECHNKIYRSCHNLWLCCMHAVIHHKLLQAISRQVHCM